MKKLLYSIAVLLSICINCPAPAPPGYVPGDNLWSTNIFGTNTFGGYFKMQPFDGITMMSQSSGKPSISLTHLGSPGWTEIIGINDNAFQIGGAPVGGGTAIPIYLIGNVNVTGNLTASGTVTGSGLVFSVTNITYATNAWFATNAPDTSLIVSSNVLAAALTDTNLYKLAQSYYPTNAAATNTDMTVAYGDIMWGTGFYWPQINGGSLSTTNYQTAVRILHATNAPAGGTNFGWDNRIRTYGSLRITNETICTFFYNPSSGTTNLFCLPVW